MTTTLPAKKTRPAAAPARPARSVTTTTTVKKKASPAKAPAAPAQEVVVKQKHKLVRDSFTIPKPEYVVLEALKLRAAKLERPTKKSEVLRAGIAALNAMSDKAFLAAITAIPTIKTGRPKSAAKAAA